MSDIALMQIEEMAVLDHDIQIEYGVSEEVAYNMARDMVLNGMTINEVYAKYVWKI